MLTGFELAARIARRDLGIRSRTEALRRLSKPAYLPDFAITPEQFAKRIGKKLAAEGFKDRDIRTLVPPGIDPDKVRLAFDDKGRFLLRYGPP
jgi:hypothetical protein